MKRDGFLQRAAIAVLGIQVPAAALVYLINEVSSITPKSEDGGGETIGLTGGWEALGFQLGLVALVVAVLTLLPQAWRDVPGGASEGDASDGDKEQIEIEVSYAQLRGVVCVIAVVILSAVSWAAIFLLWQTSGDSVLLKISILLHSVIVLTSLVLGSQQSAYLLSVETQKKDDGRIKEARDRIKSKKGGRGLCVRFVLGVSCAFLVLDSVLLLLSASWLGAMAYILAVIFATPLAVWLGFWWMESGILMRIVYVFMAPLLALIISGLASSGLASLWGFLDVKGLWGDLIGWALMFMPLVPMVLISLGCPFVWRDPWLFKMLNKEVEVRGARKSVSSN